MTETSQRLVACLERLYERYNRRELIHPDPLEFLWEYDDSRDREIVGLVASGLAYGRVAQILKSTQQVLKILGSTPSQYLGSVTLSELSEALSGFKHRFTTSSEMISFLGSLSNLQKERGLLGNIFEQLLEEMEYPQALDRFTEIVLENAGMEKCSLLPRPSRGSACKRLHLFMRWMVRSDDVDPGGWENVPASVLRVPVDVHMFRAARVLGFTRRKSADCKTAEEITESFRNVNPEDPVKYDFAITRMGIQGLEDHHLFKELFQQCGCFIDPAD